MNNCLNVCLISSVTMVHLQFKLAGTLLAVTCYVMFFCSVRFGISFLHCKTENVLAVALQTEKVWSGGR